MKMSPTACCIARGERCDKTYAVWDTANGWHLITLTTSAAGANEPNVRLN